MNVGFVLDNHLCDWEELLFLNNNPFINDITDNLKHYVNFISLLPPKGKGNDFGICAYIMTQIQGANCSIRTMKEVDRISAEVNNRALCHVVHLKHFHGLNFYPSVSLSNITSILINGAININSKNQPLYNQREFLKIGIKMVELVADKILD